MSAIDKHGKLEQEPFTFRKTKNGKVFIDWHGKQIKILKGKAAEKFTTSIIEADRQQAQLIMARITGQFKHGNEHSHLGISKQAESKQLQN
jgi:hypothetical protein